VVTEVGSGLNGRRRRLHRLLSDPAASVLVMEHRDRLVRLGVEHLEAALAASGHGLVVLDPEETISDLAGDFTDVLPRCALGCMGSVPRRTALPA
jgi:putative resolvase